MVDIEKRKQSMTVSIFVPEEDIFIIKELNSLAKTDKRIDKNKLKSKKNLISVITRNLWKGYIFKRKQEITNNSKLPLPKGSGF